MPEVTMGRGTAHPIGYSEEWKAEYDQINSNYRMLAEIRFKLLALVPALSGAAVTLLSKLIAAHSADAVGSASSVADAAAFDYALVGLLSSLGFLATLGVTVYDLRNSELYELLIRRGHELEDRFSPPLLNFKSRVKASFRLLGFVLIKHDIGLSLIYAPVLGAWFFPLVDAVLRWRGCCPRPAMFASLTTAAVVCVAFLEEFVRLDKRREKRNESRISQGIQPGTAS